MVLNGEGLPQLEMDQIIAMVNKQAGENVHFTKADGFEQVNTNRIKVIDCLLGLDDNALDMKYRTTTHLKD